MLVTLSCLVLVIETFAAVASQQAESSFQAAAALFQQGRLDEAAVVSAAALKLNPAQGSLLNLHAGIHATRADGAAERNDYKVARSSAAKAAKVSRRALQLAPNLPHVHFNLAKLLKTHLPERRKEIFTHARAAAKLQPQDAGHHIFLLEEYSNGLKKTTDHNISLPDSLAQQDLDRFLGFLRAGPKPLPKMQFYELWRPASNFASFALRNRQLREQILVEGSKAILPEESGEAWLFWAGDPLDARPTTTAEAEHNVAETSRRLKWLRGEATAGRAAVREVSLEPRGQDLRRNDGKPLRGGPELLRSPPGFNLGYYGGNQRRLIQDAAQTLMALAPRRLASRAYHSASLPGGGAGPSQAAGVLAEAAAPTARGVRVDSCTPRGRQPRRPRVGFFWGYGKENSVSYAVDWMVLDLDPDKALFDIHLLLLRAVDPKDHAKVDPALQRAANHVWQLPRDVPRARSMVMSLRLDALMFPELSLDPIRYAVSFTRMAPVQVVAVLGHPLTSGVPAIDYAVSNEAFEAPGDTARSHYTEELVRLPGLPPLLPSPTVGQYLRQPVSKTELLRTFKFEHLLPGPETPRLYVVPKNVMKLHPGFDEVFKLILQQDHDAVLVFLVHVPSEADPPVLVPAQLLERWRAAGVPCGENVLENDGRLRTPRCLVYAHWISQTNFLAFMHHADVLLETAPFGGFTATLQGLQLGRPWVALRDSEGMSAGLMATGMLDALGLSDCCVARSHRELAEKAVKVARNENGIRDRARDLCQRGASPASTTSATKKSYSGNTTVSTSSIFEAGQASISAWRSFLKASVERAWARGRALRPRGSCRRPLQEDSRP